MESNEYNPDVLNCIANLSSDQVWTSPALANKVLDMLENDPELRKRYEEYGK